MSKRLREEALKGIPTSGGMSNLFDRVENSYKINTKIKNFMLVTFMMLSTFFVYAQTSTTSGSWTTGSTWVGGSSPTLTGGASNLNTDVTIEVGHTVTLNDNLTVKSGVTLRVKGTLIIQATGDVDFQNGSTIIVESGGTLEMDMLTNSNNSTNVTIHGTLIVNGDYMAGAGASLSGNGDMTVTGTSSGNGTTFGVTLTCTDCTIDGAGNIENSIINGNQTGQHAPIEPYWSWTYSQQIYYQSEINQEGNITGLSFEYNGNSSWTDQVEVYLGNTSKSSFTSDTDWIPYSDLTLVYDGDYSVSTTAGWYSITFDTDFYYNNTDNLVIAVYEKTNGYHSVSDEFYTADGGVNRVLTYYDDYVNPDPTSPPTADYHQEWIPSLKLNISEAGAPLHIELISFTGNLNMDKSINLYWVVASEINNDYYTIEHSMNGNNWDAVGIVYGVGNTSQTLNYTFRHLEPKSGINYYILKQTDFDGKFEKFGPIAIEVVRKKQYVVAIYNLLGQPVNGDYRGVIILEWDNGEWEKVFVE